METASAPSEQIRTPIQSDIELNRYQISPEEKKRRRIKNRNINIVAAFLLCTGSIIALLINPYDTSFGSTNIDRSSNFILIALSCSGILLSIGLGLFTYLQTGAFDKILNPNAYSNYSSEPQATFSSFAEGPEDSSVGSMPSSGNTSPSTESRVRLDYQIERKIGIIQSDYRKVVQRIVDEIERLNKTANVNLLFGSLTTVAGIVVLIFNAFEPLKKIDTPNILAHYIPKISITIFIEIFAFFFLKIYKSTLYDIKYFHNERTNIEQKIMSLKTALVTEDKKIIEFVVKELSKTERNYILKKGETTVELEKGKSETNSNKNILDFLKPLLEFKKK